MQLYGINYFTLLSEFSIWSLDAFHLCDRSVSADLDRSEHMIFIKLYKKFHIRFLSLEMWLAPEHNTFLETVYGIVRSGNGRHHNDQKNQECLFHFAFL